MSISIELIIGFALKDQIVMEALGKALRNDLIIANPLYRACIAFADDFLAERRKLPLEGDWTLWTSSLPEGRRQGILEALSLLTHQDISNYDPTFFAEQVIEELRAVASRNAVYRMNAEPEKVTPEMIQALADSVSAISTDSPQSIQEESFRGMTLAKRPELLWEPEELIPRLIWRGKHIILAGPPKFGKSTIVTQGIAAATRAAPFLDGRAEGCRVLWCGVDESLNETFRRLVSFRTNLFSIELINPSTPDPKGALQRTLDKKPAQIVVIDSLIEWTRRTAKKEMPSEGDSAGWAEIIRPLTALAHERDIGLLTIHHARRSDGKFRGSGEIAAGVDLLYDMLPVPRKPSLRRFNGQGRWGMPRWIARFVDGAYEFGGEAPDLDSDLDSDSKQEEQEQRKQEKLLSEIRAFVEKNPGCSKTTLAESVSIDRKKMSAILTLMEEELMVIEPEKGKAAKIYLKTQIGESELRSPDTE